MMNRKILPFIAVALGAIILSAKAVFGQSVADIDSRLNNVDFTAMDTVIRGSGAAVDINMKDLFLKAVAGELDLSPSAIISGFMRLLFSEVYENIGLLRNLLALGIVSAVLKNLTDSFGCKAVSETGFYICYISMFAIVLSSFKTAAAILTDFAATLTMLIEAGIPLFVSLVTMSGNFTGGYIFSTIMFFSTGFVYRFISLFVAPAIVGVSTINMVNYLMEADVLTYLADLLKNIISWGLKLSAMAIVSIISIQKISTPLLNNIVMKTAKSTVNMVPVVGDILAGAVESVVYWTKAMQGGVLAAVAIAVAAVCVLPIIKLAALGLTFKLGAALIQPVCDKRIVECVNAAGVYTGLLISAGAIIALMFMACVIVMLSF